MRERPILFSGDMVRAILAGTKTQTRRPVKGMPKAPVADCHRSHTPKHSAPYFDAYCGQRKTEVNPRGMSDEWCWWQVDDRQCLPTIKCPFGAPGDHLWVRETWNTFAPWKGVFYAADDHSWGIGESDDPDHIAPHEIRWCPSIHMPRWACRLMLEIVSVRVERVLTISFQDTKAEGGTWDGVAWDFGAGKDPDSKIAYMNCWDAIYAAKGHGWDANPWVWVVEFKKLEASA